MQTILIVIHLIVVVGLVGVVLLQRSEGGALGIGGGGGFMTGRGQANVLTRATAILATLFFVTSLALTIYANLTRAPKSILEGVTDQSSPQVPTSTPAPPSGSVLDELKKIEEQRQARPPAQPEAPQSQ
jgi:preprotein translocase subunit SecG